MSVAYSAVNPLARAHQIKALFVSHERPEFPAFFDRAYPDAVRAGARSWIGVDGDELVMHISCFPHPMLMGEEMVRGGLLANLLAASSHRTFFPALALVRRMVRDLGEQGDVDFLFADPHNSAPGLLRAAGFAPVGTLRRFVLAISDARPAVRLALRAAHAAARAGTGAWRLRVTRRSARDVDASEFAEPPGRSAAVRPLRPPALYPRRLAGYPDATDHWYIVGPAAGERQALAASLCRETDLPGLTTLCALWRQPELPAGRVTLALARELRERGVARLQLWTLEESDLARELRRVGFVPRHETVPVLGLGLTDRGRRLLGSPALWETTHLDYDR